MNRPRTSHQVFEKLFNFDSENRLQSRAQVIQSHVTHETVTQLHQLILHLNNF